MARGDPAPTSQKPSSKRDDEERNEDEAQSARFIETARKLCVDETGKAFKEAIDKITGIKNSKSR